MNALTEAMADLRGADIQVSLLHTRLHVAELPAQNATLF
jgi:hypothetical protein